MWFIGLLVGFVVGAFLGQWPGALVGAFLGWLAGLALAPRKRAQPVGEPSGAAGEERIALLEKRLARAEQRLNRLEHPGATGERVEGRDEAAAAGVPDAGVVAQAPVPSPREPEAAALSPAPEAIPTDGEPPRAAPEPAAPNVLVAWLTGGNTIARVGAIILFFGVAFLVKYAADHRLLPIELRLSAVAGGALALLAAGWRLREKRRGYALTLQGAGVGLFYLTMFGAFRLYELLPAGTAFGLLVATAGLSAMLAVRQDAMALAMIGTAGGFLAPVLTSTGGGNHVALFGYYAVLNAGILAIAWRKSWRPLNLLGFFFTAAIGFLWGWRNYRDGLFASTEAFLVFFFVLYVAIAVLHASRPASRAARYADGTLIFGTPLVAFGFQAAMLQDERFALAGSAVAVSAFYLVLARVLHARRRDELRLLVESFLALGVVFATLAIPFALDARWTSAAWALEGLGIVWAGARQGRWLARAFGIALQVLAGFVFLDVLNGGMLGDFPVLNGAFIGAFLIALAGVASNRLLSGLGENTTVVERAALPLLFAWGLGWWLFAGANEIDRFLTDGRFSAGAAFLAGTALAFSALSTRLAWPHASWPTWGLAPALAGLAAVTVAHDASLLANLGWLAWPFAFHVHLKVLRGHEEGIAADWLQWLHAIGFLLAAAMGSWELHWFARSQGLGHSAWSVAAAMLVPALALVGIATERAGARWPVQRFPDAYLVRGALPVVVALWLWTFYANATHDGRSEPLPYLPLLNAIDLGHVLGLFAVFAWVLALRRTAIAMPVGRYLMRTAAAGAVFVWLNAILLRTIHHWAGVAYELDTMLRSVLVQSALSLFWTLLALVLMFAATRKGWRVVWIAGAALMAVVVGKLFFVDLSHIAGLERIVSFIGVGLLMLLVGYLAPVPPRKEGEA